MIWTKCQTQMRASCPVKVIALAACRQATLIFLCIYCPVGMSSPVTCRKEITNETRNPD